MFAHTFQTISSASFTTYRISYHVVRVVVIWSACLSVGLYCVPQYHTVQTHTKKYTFLSSRCRWHKLHALTPISRCLFYLSGNKWNVRICKWNITTLSDLRCMTKVKGFLRSLKKCSWKRDYELFLFVFTAFRAKRRQSTRERHQCSSIRPLCSTGKEQQQKANKSN